MTTIIIIDEITNANAYNTIIRIIINNNFVILVCNRILIIIIILIWYLRVIHCTNC